MIKFTFTILFTTLVSTIYLCGQKTQALFNIRDVTLSEGDFKHAQNLNIDVLLSYDVDRLLEPFLTEAGLTPKGEAYSNWDGLAGHIGGHYLTALAMNYAATGNDSCKIIMEYMLDELKHCQDANGNGYVGGVPNSEAIWEGVKAGNFTLFYGAWVPWYNVHKIYAGLRDAWLYGESETAKQMFLDLCDWGIDIVENLNDIQMQGMLNTEFGGMNEVYADAYAISGDTKYLTTAKKFTHNYLFNAMVNSNDNLDNMHANTQIPKVVGFSKVACYDSSAIDYRKAAEFFWSTVVENRSLSLGGNSRSEHFPSVAACREYISHREGPESCNTYNMLKLTEDLFCLDHQAKYVDFYERALYNHILSTQHPEHGGYVYFTPARPQHYRVYSAPNEAMWCCVGSGMENHGKYGQFIYAHDNDSLFVNLFIPSVLNWQDKNIEISQSTSFPYDDSTSLTLSMTSAENFTLLLRRPFWAGDGFKVYINGEEQTINAEPSSYVALHKIWNNGDVISMKLPMDFRFEEMPNVPEYVALMYGPVLLSANMGTDNLDGLIADDSRWGHIANGELKGLDEAPIMIGDRTILIEQFEVLDDSELQFSAASVFSEQTEYQDLILQPFFEVHDARYMMYWMALTQDEYDDVLGELSDEEEAALLMDQRTTDGIATGEQQPDADHSVTGENSYTGVYNNEYYRDAREGGYFAYEMATEGESDLSLMVRYWGNESGARAFNILIDGEIIDSEDVSGKWGVNEFKNVEYDIPAHLLEDKSYIEVKFQALPNNVAGGVYYLRLLRPTENNLVVKGMSNNDKIFYDKSTNQLNIELNNQIKGFTYRVIDLKGRILIDEKVNSSSTSVNLSEFSIPLVFVQCYNQNLNIIRKLIL